MSAAAGEFQFSIEEDFAQRAVSDETQLRMGFRIQGPVQMEQSVSAWPINYHKVATVVKKKTD